MENMLSPRLVVVSGMPAAGKTTIAEELASRIPNAVHFSRDHITYGGLLYVNHLVTQTPSLPPFEEYVSRDRVFPNDAETVETPFGPMTLIHDSTRSDFYKRHAREQSYLIMGRLAEASLKVGKVAIIEGFLGRSIESGALKAFMDQKGFNTFPKYLIHVVADYKICLARQKDRAKKDKEAAIRAKTGYVVEEGFEDLMDREHPRSPKGIENIPHFILDTSSVSLEECLRQCIGYISS